MSTPQLDPIIRAEIQATSKFLHQLEKLSPVVAGGAICSWISGQAARDIDIWIPETALGWEMEMEAMGLKSESAKTAPTMLVGGNQISTAIESSKTQTDIEVYKTTIPVGHSIKCVDLVIYSERDHAWSAFDWTYSMMAWGWDISLNKGVISNTGLDDFARGQLVQGSLFGERSRPRDVAIMKTQKYSGFGAGMKTRLGFDMVMTALSESYPQSLEIGDTCSRCGRVWKVRELAFSTFTGCLC